MSKLPDWAEAPIDIKQAAVALGVSRKTLDVVMKNPCFIAGIHFELRGKRKIFYREHIVAMRKEMTKCAYTLETEKGGSMPVGLNLTASPSNNLSILKTLAKQKKH